MDITPARLYTVAEANAMLAVLEPLLLQMQDEGARLAEIQATLNELGRKLRSNGHIDHTSEITELARAQAPLEQSLRESVGQLAEWGIQLKDLQRGLVDFPALREGRVVFLCWHLGETEVAFWHETESGFDGRQPLDEQFR
jgi:hypothetical protein